MENKNKKKIVILSTGGTIASKRNPETGLLTAGILSGDELAKMCQLPDSITITISPVFQILSSQMTFEKLEVLKGKIDQVFKDAEVDGIVVTHGTDTLEETAYFLDLTIDDDRPVIVTGSQRGPSILGSDAFVNLRQAILLAAHPDTKRLGPLVLFNERIFSPRYVKKVHASNVAGFTAFGFGYLGIVDGDELFIYQKPLKRETYKLQASLPNVEIVKSSLGSDGKFIRFAADEGAKGIIIEAAGRGHVHQKNMKDIVYAREKGVHIILTTSTEEGEVKMIYDFPGSVYDMNTVGVILGKDYDSKKARIKLAVLLASGVENIAEKFNY